MRTSALLFALLIFHSAPSSAKPVNLAWDSIDGASKYEVSIEHQGNSEIQLTLDHPEWHGDLSYGLHVYRVRAIDLAGRAGSWSQPNPLVILPPPIPTISPELKKVFELLPGQNVLFQWAKVEGVSGYHFELKKQDEVIYSSEVTGGEIRVGDLTAGNYSWTVTGVISADNSYPSLIGRKWKTSPSITATLTIQRKSLNAPKLLFPIGEVWPSKDGLLEFHWAPVKDAVVYEIRIRKKAAQIADRFDKTFRTESNSSIIKVGTTGQFEWTLKALSVASGDNIVSPNPGSTPVKETWSDASAEFSLVDIDLFAPKGNEVALRAGYKQVDLQFIDYSRNLQGKVSSQSPFVGVDGQHWFASSWALSSSIEATYLRIDTDVAVFRFDALVKFHDNLGYGWVYEYWAGPEFRQLPLLSPTNGGDSTSINNLSMFDLSAGNSLSLSLNSSWSGRGQVKIFYPVSILSGANGSSLSPGSHTVNFALGLSALYAKSQNTTFIYSLGWESQKIALDSSLGVGKDQQATFSSIALGLALAQKF